MRRQGKGTGVSLGMSLKLVDPSRRRRRALNRPRGITMPAWLSEPIRLSHWRRVNVAEWKALNTRWQHLSWLSLES